MNSYQSHAHIRQLCRENEGWMIHKNRSDFRAPGYTLVQRMKLFRFLLSGTQENPDLTTQHAENTG